MGLRTLYAKYAVREPVRRAGFWFVDIPRTSSSTLKYELGAVFGRTFSKDVEATLVVRKVLGSHTPARVAREVLGPRIWDAILTFSMVRNPYARAASIYSYARRNAVIPLDMEFKEFVKYLTDYKNHEYSFGILRRTQLSYLADMNGNILVDLVGRFENRSEFLDDIGGRIGAPGIGRRLRASKRETIGMDPGSAELIASYFADDFARFDYAIKDIPGEV